MPYASVDLTRIKTYPLVRRENRVALDDMVFPDTPCPVFDSPELAEVAERVAAARAASRPVVMMFGGHIIKRGLAPLVIDLLRKGVITHLASNGAATIHDFEIAFLGHTSEDVVKSLADGSFGMAEETGALMNAAIRAGAADGIGLGEALGRMTAGDPRFTFRDHSVLYTAHSLGIPYTVHVAVGTDIIHQHPAVDFAATGWASGQDFKVFCQAVCGLEGGVFLNFGSAVIGPEVFLKALSIARNLGNPLRVFTTANFDIIPMRDYREPVDDHNPDYYYRPRKNVVNRPVMLGGRGYHITGDHAVTLPNLYRMVMAQFPPTAPVNQNTATAGDSAEGEFERHSPEAAAVLRKMIRAEARLSSASAGLRRAYTLITRSWASGRTLFVVGEPLAGLFEAGRPGLPLPAQHRQRLGALPGGEELARHLRSGPRVIDLRNCAAGPDAEIPGLGLAQALYRLARPGDVLLATGGENGPNLLHALRVARMSGLVSVVLGGSTAGMEGLADVVIAAPAGADAPGGADVPGGSEAQEWNLLAANCLRAMLYARFASGEEQV